MTGFRNRPASFVGWVLSNSFREARDRIGDPYEEKLLRKRHRSEAVDDSPPAP
jgi:hypothetical protein